jgi:hypothetical protein
MSTLEQEKQVLETLAGQHTEQEAAQQGTIDSQVLQAETDRRRIAQVINDQLSQHVAQLEAILARTPEQSSEQQQQLALVREQIERLRATLQQQVLGGVGGQAPLATDP